MKKVLSYLFVLALFMGQPLLAHAAVADISSVPSYGTTPGSATDSAEDWVVAGSRIVWFASPSGQSPFAATDGQVMMTDVSTGVTTAISDPLYEFSGAVITDSGVIWGSKEKTSGIYKYDFATGATTVLVTSTPDVVISNIHASKGGEFITYHTDDGKDEVYNVAQKTTQSISDFLGVQSTDSMSGFGSFFDYTVGPTYVAHIETGTANIIVRHFTDSAPKKVDFSSINPGGFGTTLMSLTDADAVYTQTLNGGSFTFNHVAIDSGVITPAPISIQQNILSVDSADGAFWKHGLVYEYYDPATQTMCPTTITKDEKLEDADVLVVTNHTVYWARNKKLYYEPITCRTDLDPAALQKLENTSDTPSITALQKMNWSGQPLPIKGVLQPVNSIDAANGVAAVSSSQSAVQQSTTYFNSVIQKLQKIAKTLPQNITTEADANTYLDAHPDLLKQLESTASSALSSAITKLSDSENGYQKGAITAYQIGTGKIFSIPTQGMPALLHKMWSVGPTGVVWVRVLPQGKTSAIAGIHWYDFATKKDRIVARISAADMAKISEVNLHAEYNSFVVELDLKNNTRYMAYNTKTGKLIKQIDTNTMPAHQTLNTISTGSHYLAWSISDGSTFMTTVHVLDLNSNSEKTYSISSSARTIKIYSETALIDDAGGHVEKIDLQNHVVTDVVLPPVLEKHSDRKLIFFDGTRMVFQINQPDAIVIAPMTGGDLIQYSLDTASNFVGFTGTSFLLKENSAVTVPQIQTQPHDPFQVQAAIKLMEQERDNIINSVNDKNAALYKM